MSNPVYNAAVKAAIRKHPFLWLFDSYYRHQSRMDADNAAREAERQRHKHYNEGKRNA